MIFPSNSSLGDNDKVLPHPITALAEPIFESTNQRQYSLPRTYPRHPHAVHPPRLLGLHSVRRKDETDSEHDREPHLGGGWLAGV